MGTPTARNVAPSGSEYAETVRSNHCRPMLSSSFTYIILCLISEFHVSQRIFREVMAQNKESIRLQLTQIVNKVSSQQITARTMRRELQRIRMHSRLPVKKPFTFAGIPKFVCSDVGKADTCHLKNRNV
ncbi:hypothetical protein TNCV_3687611 [Trichonephila clavipes]|nr:hypothetical protein TNCV_3687611 [Trichonephila clavipes]